MKTSFMIGNRIRKFFAGGQGGFTLIEMIIVLAIFSVLIVIITDVFLMAMRAQQQTARRQQAASVVRNIVETIARQVRTSEIDYASYGPVGVAAPAADLYLRDQSGRLFHYYYDDSVAGAENIKVAVDGQTAANLVDSGAVRVRSLKFYVSPDTDPFAVETCAGKIAVANGCETDYCTVTDAAAPPTGYCGCTQPADCASNRCETNAYYAALFHDYCCAPGVCGVAGGICLPKNEQPRVTIVLYVQSKGPRPEDVKDIYLQTTATSRIYKR